MMIGPDPMMRIFLMSVRFGIRAIHRRERREKYIMKTSTLLVKTLERGKTLASPFRNETGFENPLHFSGMARPLCPQKRHQILSSWPLHLFLKPLAP
jgi:transposase InsO family protein